MAICGLNQCLLSLFRPFDLHAHNDFYILWLSNLLIMSTHDEGYSRNRSRTLNSVSKLLIQCITYILVIDLISVQGWVIPAVHCSGLGDTCCSLPRAGAWGIPFIYCTYFLFCILKTCWTFQRKAHKKNILKKNGLVRISQAVSLLGGLFVSKSTHLSSYLFYGCHIWSRNCIPFRGTRVQPRL